jgi:hypothetical protein
MSYHNDCKELKKLIKNKKKENKEFALALVDDHPPNMYNHYTSRKIYFIDIKALEQEMKKDKLWFDVYDVLSETYIMLSPSFFDASLKECVYID